MWSRMKQGIKTAVRNLTGVLVAITLLRSLPLSVRKWIVLRLGRYNFAGQYFFAAELLRDFARTDPMRFHQFLWEHHVGGHAYGKTYEIAYRFGEENLKPSRRELCEMLRTELSARGIAPENQVQSVFDVGCSLGYMLHFLETQVFPSATCLQGLDVDRYAVTAGNEHLRRVESKVALLAGEISDLDSVMGKRKYDVILCCGVLMYLDEEAAASAIQTMLAHTQKILGVISLADPRIDNAQLPQSYARTEDLGFVHNVDRMVRKAGGQVINRKWTGPEEATRYSRNPPLFTLAEPHT